MRTVPAGTADVGVVDPHDVRRATDPPGVLEPFNVAGVLGPADVHGARTLCALAGDERPPVLLAAALAIRAPQHGHVCIELGSVATTVTGVDEAPVSTDALDWPEPAAWRAALEDSPLVVVRPPGTTIPDPQADRPLSLVGDRLYLDRFWRYERRVAEVLRKRADRLMDGVDPAVVRASLDRLLPPGGERPDRQRIAVATGALRALTVIAGGPGTGKTHTVARLLALLHELTTDRWPRVAVAAPTGKAADRLTAALREAAVDVDSSDRVRARLGALEGSTLHRLLGTQPGSLTRFRHGRDHQLPHEVVVVDETSMVDLPLMAKLLVALRPTSRLVLVGDPDQLASVEAGAVLADIVGPAVAGDAEPRRPGGGAGSAGGEHARRMDDDERLRMSEPARATLELATGEPLSEVDGPRPGGIDDAIVVLGTVRRFAPGSGIARLATAIHAGDPDAAITALRAGHADVSWVEGAGDAGDRDELSPVRTRLVEAFRPGFAAAGRGDAAAALEALEEVRVLCAHRRGTVGVAGWVGQVERWLADELEGFDPTGRWYVGRPVLVTRNDQRLRLFNGDVGVVVRDDGGLQVAFHGAHGVRRIGPSRLEDVETVHAMTIHKSQGSQFGHVVVVLPDEDSSILTRELLYTAVTRARRGVTVVGPEASVRHAIGRRVARASGLRETLWGQA